MMCKVAILKDRGGHFEIQNGGIKLHDPDCYHINMLQGSILGKISGNPDGLLR